MSYTKVMEQDYNVSTVFFVNTAAQEKEGETLPNCSLTRNVGTDENHVEMNEVESSLSNEMINFDNSAGNECDVSASQLCFSSEQRDGEPDKLTCIYCSKTFSTPGNKNRHVRRVHKQHTNDGNYKCIECNISFRYLFRLREHLQEVHGMNMQVEVLRFPTMQGFRKWKCEIERKTLCFYFLRTKNNRQNRLLVYSCHRSGNYKPKRRGPRQRITKSEGTCRTGIPCTSNIFCRINSNEIIVRYCPHHYGHGKETTLMHLTPQEHRAITENVSKGISFEKLLDGIRDSQSTKDHFQLHFLKKKDIRNIKNAYKCKAYNSELNDAESIDHWVHLCHQIQNSPILAYRHKDFINGTETQDEFLLIIMTEFQKHVLVTSNKQVVCVMSLFRRRGGPFYLTVLFVMDEYDLAFPVAFCISSKVDKSVITQFFDAIKQSVGPLSATYFISENVPLFYDTWKEVMNDEAEWLWGMWYVDYKIRGQLKLFKGNTEKRGDVYKTMRILLECRDETIFSAMFENFVEKLLNDSQTKDFGNLIKQHFGCNQDMWARCYRKDINLSTDIHLEIMHRILRYCCREGKKTKLNKFIFVLMKFVRDKMLDRFTNSIEEEKMNLARESINACHTLGLEILISDIDATSEKLWLIRSKEKNFYVSQEMMTCFEHCNLRCEECDICIHMFTCNCVHNLINGSLCAHIHAVVWNLLTPHFNPISDQVAVDESMYDIGEKNTEDCSELFESVLKKTHDLYRKIRSNKCNMNEKSLNCLLKGINKWIDICSGKVPETIMQSQSTQTSNSKSTVLLNPVLGNGISQPLIIPNQFPNALSNNALFSQYVILLPNNNVA